MPTPGIAAAETVPRQREGGIDQPAEGPVQRP